MGARRCPRASGLAQNLAPASPTSQQVESRRREEAQAQFAYSQVRHRTNHLASHQPRKWLWQMPQSSWDGGKSPAPHSHLLQPWNHLLQKQLQTQFKAKPRKPHSSGVRIPLPDRESLPCLPHLAPAVVRLGTAQPVLVQGRRQHVEVPWLVPGGLADSSSQHKAKVFSDRRPLTEQHQCWLCRHQEPTFYFLPVDSEASSQTCCEQLGQWPSVSSLQAGHLVNCFGRQKPSLHLKGQGAVSRQLPPPGLTSKSQGALHHRWKGKQKTREGKSSLSLSLLSFGLFMAPARAGSFPPAAARFASRDVPKASQPTLQPSPSKSSFDWKSSF